MLNRFTVGFTLVELLVVLAIMALLAAIAVQGARTVREQASATACRAGLRDVGLLMLQFAGDHRGRLPFFNTGPDGSWAVALHQQVQDGEWGTTMRTGSRPPAPFACPMGGALVTGWNDGNADYGMNANIQGALLGVFAATGDIMLAADATSREIYQAWPVPAPAFRHRDATQMVLLDGHVEGGWRRWQMRDWWLSPWR